MKKINLKTDTTILILLSIVMNIDILYLLYPFVNDLIYNTDGLAFLEIVAKYKFRLNSALLSLSSTIFLAITIYKTYNWLQNSLKKRIKAYSYSIGAAFVLVVLTVAIHHILLEDLEPNVSTKITIFRLFVWYGARATYMTMITLFIADLNLKKESEKIKIKKIHELETELYKSKYGMLKEQINPHFIFNTINTLSALIQNDDLKAEIYIQKLSSLLSYSISEKDISAASKEISVGIAYAYLIQLRYNEAVKFIFNTENCPEEKSLPIFAIQTLLENAVKHNLISLENQLIVEINCYEEFVEVKNNIQKKKEIFESTGIGLFNLSQRYKLLSNKELSITNNDLIFCVKLPYI